MKAAPQSRRLTDSPWFWVHTFGIAALVALFLIGQKADKVQQQRDGNFTRRQVSLERQAGKVGAHRSTDSEVVPEVEVLSDTRYVDFAPFYTILGLITVAAWVMLWRQHFMQRPAAPHAQHSA